MGIHGLQLAILIAACRYTDDIFCLYLATLVVSAQISDPYSRTEFTIDINNFRFPCLGPPMLAMSLDKEDATDAIFHGLDGLDHLVLAE